MGAEKCHKKTTGNLNIPRNEKKTDGIGRKCRDVRFAFNAVQFIEGNREGDQGSNWGRLHLDCVWDPSNSVQMSQAYSTFELVNESCAVTSCWSTYEVLFHYLRHIWVWAFPQTSRRGGLLKMTTKVSCHSSLDTHILVIMTRFCSSLIFPFFSRSRVKVFFTHDFLLAKNGGCTTAT